MVALSLLTSATRDTVLGKQTAPSGDFKDEMKAYTYMKANFIHMKAF